MEASGGRAGEGRVKNATLIAGPTASGKSALALELAERSGGVVVNADSMQVYSVLKVLTARPGAEEEARAPHLLYGHVPPSLAHSAGAWLRDVERLADSVGRSEARHLPPSLSDEGLVNEAASRLGLGPEERYALLAMETLERRYAWVLDQVRSLQSRIDLLAPYRREGDDPRWN